MSLCTRLPEVCTILAEASKGASALHHDAAHRNAPVRIAGWSKKGAFSRDRGGKGPRGVRQASR